MLTIGPLVPFSASAAGPGTTPTLQITGPSHVEAGGTIDLKLAIVGGNDIAGFESAVLFDPSAAEFDDMQMSNNTVHALGRDVEPLAAVETSYGAAVGFYSCGVSDCLNNRSPHHSHGANGTVDLGTVTLIGDEAGALVITFDAVKVVDASGNPIAINVPNPTLTVQVGSGAASPNQRTPDTVSPAVGGSGSVHASPAGRWTLPHGGHGKAGPFTITGRSTISNADVMEVAMAWENLRARPSFNPCGADVDPALDVNHDGCIDVADIQAVAASYSPTNISTTSSASPNVTRAGGVNSTAVTSAANPVIIVNSTGDQSDANKTDGICMTSVNTCTLRAAIQTANNDVGPDTIHFDIASAGVQTIHINSQLPSLNDSSGATTIDGYSEPGSSPNTAELADNAQIMIQVEGAGYSNTDYDGLAITSAGNLIQGIAFYAFHRPLWIYGSGATDNVIIGDFVGTNAAGTAHAADIGDNEAHGIKIEQGAARTIVGRPTLADRNVISGNARTGVSIWHGNSNNEIIQNNILGLTPDGTHRLSNQLHGIDLNYGSHDDIIGGTGQYERNVSSGNNYNGIDVSHTAQTSHNQIVGNYVGTTLDGNSSPGYTYNLRYGIRVKDGASYNTVTDNVIGGMNNHVSDGNGNVGIAILDDTTSHNTFARNRIGISLNGTPMPNSTGIAVYGLDNTIGSDNIIADNAGPGIEVESTAVNDTIAKNSIFGNSGLGIKLDSGANNSIAAPSISSATTSSVSGQACANCTIEAFIADSGAGQPGEGQTFVGSGSADGSGAFSVSMSGVSSGDEITATATDSSGDTSQFALNVQVGGGSPPPAITLPGHFEVEAYNPGGEGVGYHDTTTGNSGNATIRNDDVDIQTCTDSTTPSGQTCYNIGWTAAGEWLAYSVTITNAGNYTFAIRVASPNTGESLHFEVDGNNVTGSIAIPKTGGWQNWKTVTSNPVSLPAGTHTLKLVEDTGGYNLNYIDIAAVVASPPPPPTNLVASPVSSSEIDLRWTDNATNETAYDVERSLDGTNFTPLNANLPPNTSSYADTGLTASTHYYYRVRATNSSGSSGYATADTSTLSASDTTNLPGRVEAENYLAGGEGVGYYDTTPGNTGGAYRTGDVDIQTCTDSTTLSGQTCYNVGWTAAGEWLAYNVNISTAGNYTFAIRVASPNTGEKLHLELDGTNFSGAISIPKTGGWQNWQTVTIGPIALPSGTHVLKLVEDTGGYNLNYIDVAASP